MKYCHAHRIQVVPQGGNTGLVGGSIPVKDELIMSLSRMNKIESFDVVSGVVVCQAGCILEHLDDWLAKQDIPFMAPIDLGAKGSCQIGGNLSTNAGGIRFMRYGSLRGAVVGMEVVLADGKVLNSLSLHTKDNTGYFLPSIFVGSEGTLGIITRAAIKCPLKPAYSMASFVACKSFESVMEIYSLARVRLGENLSAIELIDGSALELVRRGFPNIRMPFELVEANEGYCVLVEASGSHEDHIGSKMDAFLEEAFEENLVQQGVVSQGIKQYRQLWQLREHIPLSSQAQSGVQRKYDISLPLVRFSWMLRTIRVRLKERGYPDIDVVGYGHMGDGNLHVNVCGIPESEAPAVISILEPFVYELAVECGGSISAEHGIGQLKMPYLRLQKPETDLMAMRLLKQAFDPTGILNPGKLLPPRDT